MQKEIASASGVEDVTLEIPCDRVRPRFHIADEDSSSREQEVDSASDIEENVTEEIPGGRGISFHVVHQGPPPIQQEVPRRSALGRFFYGENNAFWPTVLTCIVAGGGLLTYSTTNGSRMLGGGFVVTAALLMTPLCIDMFRRNR